MKDIFKRYIKDTNIIAIVSVSILIIVLFIASKYDVDIVNNIEEENDDNIVEISETKVYNSSGDVINAELPFSLPKGKYYMLISQKKTDKYTPVYFKITSINTKFKLSFGQDVIFENSLEPKLQNLCFPSVNMIRIPDKYDGKEIKISFESADNISRYISIPNVYIGSKRGLILNTRIIDSIELIVSGIIFLLAYILIFASVILYKSKANQYQVYYVAIFSIAMSISSAINTSYIKVLFPNSIFLYYLYYILFTIMPISLLLLHFYQLVLNESSKWRINLIKYAIYISSCVVVLEMLYIMLNFNKEITLYIFVIINIVLSVICVPITLIKLDGKNYNDRLILILAMIPIILIYIEKLGLYLHFRTTISDMSYSAIYALIFLGIYLYIALTAYYKSYKQLEMSVYYQNIAFVDSLTGVGSRYALDNKIQSMKARNNNRFIIMFIDVNSLKLINDKMGHEVGDLVLESLGKIIIEAESVFNNISAYRFGGDEFIIIISKCKSGVADKLKKYLKNSAKKLRDSKEKIPISLAIAYDEVVIEENMDIEDIIKNVDKKMYEDKQNKEKAL